MPVTEYVSPLGAETLDYTGRKSVVGHWRLYDAVLGVDHIAPFVSLKETWAQQPSEVAKGRGQRYWKSKEDAERHPELVALARQHYNAERREHELAKLNNKLTKVGDATVRALKDEMDALKDRLALDAAHPPAPAPAAAEPAAQPAEAPAQAPLLDPSELYIELSRDDLAGEYHKRAGKTAGKNWTRGKIIQELEKLRHGVEAA